jgi:beta-glucosidase
MKMLPELSKAASRAHRPGIDLRRTMVPSLSAWCVVAILGWSGSVALAATAGAPTNGAHPDVWPARTRVPLDAATESFVSQLLSQMTLEEKVGQMIQADIASIAPADLHTYHLGSILAGGGAAPGNNVRAPAKAWRDLTDEFNRASMAGAGGAHVPIPIIFGIDAVHGHAKVVGATIFPHNVGLGAAHDPDLIRRIGQATAEEVAATGIDWTFAPTVAVARDVRWGRSYESYSESPPLVSQYAAAMVVGLQGQRDSAQFMTPGRTLSSVKHFLGDGGTEDGRDQGNTVISEQELSQVHGAAYISALDAGAMIVMASYNSWNGVKMHANPYLLTDILKGRLAFDGFVVGDWNAHEQIPGCTKFDCPAAFNAGIDMLMAPDGWKQLFQYTVAEAKSGQISPQRIDDAVRRILRVKSAAGFFRRPAPAQRGEAMDLARLGNAAHRAIAREAVRKSLVLLKNEHATLPLNPHARILVAGDAADSIGMQTGGWTIDWQGDHNRNADLPGATSIYAGIRAAVTAAGGTATLSAQGRYKVKPDAAIVVFGETPYAEFEGDRESLVYSPDSTHDRDLLRRLHAAGVSTVAVFLSGRPLWVNPEINAADAFVAAWLPGSEGEGIADVLFRSAAAKSVDFTGRLSFSWPRTGMPVTYDAAGKVSGALFPQGFGLDYASSVESPPLAEDPQVPAHWRSPPGSLVREAHVIAPWILFAANDIAQVHLTTQRQLSPQSEVSLEVVPEGYRASWTGGKRGMIFINGRARDLRAQARRGDLLTLRYRVDQAPDQEVLMGIRCTEVLCGTKFGAVLNLTRTLGAAPTGAWQTLSFPLSCLSAAGADLSAVESPFVVTTSGHFGLTMSDVSLGPKTAGSATACP